jgi:hypothetical protein
MESPARHGGAFMPVIPATGEAKVEGLWSKASPCKNVRIYLKKQTKGKRAGGVTEVVLAKCEAPSSIPSTVLKKKKCFCLLS